jgi:hypothetical protein
LESNNSSNWVVIGSSSTRSIFVMNHILDIHVSNHFLILL